MSQRDSHLECEATAAQCVTTSLGFHIPEHIFKTDLM